MPLLAGTLQLDLESDCTAIVGVSGEGERKTTRDLLWNQMLE